MRARRQIKRDGLSRYTTKSLASKERRVRGVVTSSWAGAPSTRGWGGFRPQREHWRPHMRARRQIKRGGLSRYTTRSNLHQKNDGCACSCARGVVTSSWAGAPSTRGWGGVRPQREHWRPYMRARRQIKRGGLSRYTTLGNLHQKNDGFACSCARGVVTSSWAGALSTRGWGGFRPQREHWRPYMRARRQIKRGGLSRYTTLGKLRQKNDGCACSCARFFYSSVVCL